MRRESQTVTAVAFAVTVTVTAAAATLAGGCVDRVDASIRSCPCAAGNVCCESGVCAEDQAACGAATLALSQSVRGEWAGYIENYKAPPNDAIRIAVSVAGDGTLSGVVKLGAAGAPPAPPTDPALPWPPGRSEEQTSYVSGFAYDARDMSWQAKRLRLSVQTYQPWEAWCGLQTSYPQSNAELAGAFSCVPDGLDSDAGGNCSVPGTTPTDPRIPVNCDAASLCYEMCRCDAASCGATPDVFYRIDIAFDGSRAEGSISLWNSNFNLRLDRVHGGG